MGAVLNLLPRINPVPHNSDTTAIAMRPDYLRFTKNGNAALLLSQLVYWYQADKTGKAKIRIYKDGVFWRKMDHNDWFNEVGLTRSQSRTATKRLIGLGIIEVKNFLFGRDKCQHYRLLCAEGKAVLPGYPKFNPPVSDAPPSPAHGDAPCVDPDTPLGGKNDHGPWSTSPHPEANLTMTVAKVAQPFTDTVPDNATDIASDTENLPTDKSVGYTPIQIPKTLKELTQNQVGIKGFKEISGEIFEENIVNLQETLKNVENKRNEKKDLGFLWNQKLSEITGVTSKPMTSVQRKMIKEIKRELGEENLSNNNTVKTLECLNFVMSDWKKFAKEVNRRKTLQKPPPTLPCVFFFRAHWDVAVQLIAQESSITKTSVSKPKVSQEKTSNVVPLYKKPDILPTIPVKTTEENPTSEKSYKEKLKELYKL